MIISTGRLPCSPPAWPPRTTARAPSTPSRTVFLWWFAIFQDLCKTLSRIFDLAQLFSKIFAQLFPGDEHGQLHDVDRGQRLHEQLWSDNQLRQQLRIQSGWMGSTTEYVSIAMGYFDLLPHLLIRNALNHPMHDGHNCSYIQQRGDHKFRRGQSHNG